MSRLHGDRLSTRHRKKGSEILKLDVRFHYPLAVYVLPNLRMIKFHTLFVLFRPN
ncbi:MAG: hypothetical protein V7K40_14705 [Nostoc sp.]